MRTALDDLFRLRCLHCRSQDSGSGSQKAGGGCATGVVIKMTPPIHKLQFVSGRRKAVKSNELDA